MTSAEAFAGAERYRRELQAHCYRMLGSTHEAEDAVQETLLRAWRATDRFRGRTPLRSWLYRIATNVALTMLTRRRAVRRVIPYLVGSPSKGRPRKPSLETPWLEPYPDALLEGVPDEAPGPHARYETREATELAFVAAIQLLPARQRATLLLRDVLGFSALETAKTLATTVVSINSALQRARETLRKHLAAPGVPRASRPTKAFERRLVDRYVRTWEAGDLDGFVALLAEDAILAMPPRREWYRGRASIRKLLAWAWPKTGYTAARVLPVAANGQPGFALYGRERDGAPWEAHALHVATLERTGVSTVTMFMDTSVFTAFGLSLTLRP